MTKYPADAKNVQYGEEKFHHGLGKGACNAGIKDFLFVLFKVFFIEFSICQKLGKNWLKNCLWINGEKKQNFS